MRYVGITGLVSRAEVDFALSVLPEGLTLMCGVLVSTKSLRGIPNKWRRRYPDPEGIADIFLDDLRCLNLIHYSSDEVPGATTVYTLQRLGGEHCHGFQFNGAYPEPSSLAALAGGHVVLQVRPDGKAAMDRLHSAVRALRNCDVHVLIDASGGRGLPINNDVADAWAMTIRGHFGNDVHVGFAGGLDADSLPRIASEVRIWNASIDAEGRLRDGDEGGVLNREKVQAYLRVAGEVMRAQTAPEG